MTKETIFAHTEPAGQYPAYINLSSTDGGLRRLTVRSRGNDGRDTAFIDLTPLELAGLAASILTDTTVVKATTAAAPTCANVHGECCGGCLERKADAPKSQSMPAVGAAWTVIDPSNPATLPPKGDWLVTVDTDNGREVHVLWLDEDKQWWHAGDYVFAHAYYFRPIAWAPRPEAYSGPVPSEG